MRCWAVVCGAFITLAAVLSACGGGGGVSAPASATAQAYAPTIIPARFTERITNRYLPYKQGTAYVYEGTKDGEPQRNEVTVTSDTKTIVGVRCVVVHDVVTRNGDLVEETFDWYAQDSEGNVWYFGEDARNTRAARS